MTTHPHSRPLALWLLMLLLLVQGISATPSGFLSRPARDDEGR